MAHHVARTIYARTLAVPEAEHTVEFAFAAQFGLLTAPQGRCGKVFVQPRLERNIILGQWLKGSGHLHVHCPQRRSAIPGHQTGGIEPRRAITCLLHEHQTHQRLRTIQQDRRLLQVEAIVQ